MSDTRMKNTVAAGAQEQPERRKPSSAAGWSGEVGSWPSRTRSFLEDVRSEAKRVTWPSFLQIRSTTVVVILTVFFFGVYFGILDWIFNNVIRRLLRLGS